MTTSKWGMGGPASDRAADSRVLGELLASGQAIKASDGCVLPVFRPRVLAGMKLLDEICPGWQRAIDLDSLDLEDDQQCVLGQAWPIYAKLRGLVEAKEPLVVMGVGYVPILATDRPGDYKEFADTVLSVGGEAHRNDMAASIGCALSPTDFALIRAQLAQVPPPPPFNILERERITVQAVRRIWETLTFSWIREIQLAQREGRWDQTTSTPREAQVVNS